MSAEQTLAALLEFVDHKDNCDFLQPMWHKGPCDCGLFAWFEAFEKCVPLSTGHGLVESIEKMPSFQRWKNRGEHER